jgi:hypothetical protein
MVLLSLLILDQQVVLQLVTRTALKFIPLLQIFNAVVQELPLIAIMLLKESRESLKCIDSILILKAEFKWLLVDYHLRLLNMEEILESILLLVELIAKVHNYLKSVVMVIATPSHS